MPQPYKPIRYRRNPRPLPNVQGPKVQDEQSGFWSYEGYMSLDDFGTKVDSRDTTFDRDKTEGEGVGS